SVKPLSPEAPLHATKENANNSIPHFLINLWVMKTTFQCFVSNTEKSRVRILVVFQSLSV
ncbi:MAG: hypothetical protein ACI8VI_000313, partial [Granulosicoccus sp.]